MPIIKIKKHRISCPKTSCAIAHLAHAFYQGVLSLLQYTINTHVNASDTDMPSTVVVTRLDAPTSLAITQMVPQFCALLHRHELRPRLHHALHRWPMRRRHFQQSHPTMTVACYTAVWNKNMLNRLQYILDASN